MVPETSARELLTTGEQEVSSVCIHRYSTYIQPVPAQHCVPA